VSRATLFLLESTSIDASHRTVSVSTYCPKGKLDAPQSGGHRSCSNMTLDDSLRLPSRFSSVIPKLVRDHESKQTYAGLSAERKETMLGTILLILLVLLLIGALPTWPHSRGWGYYPSGGLGLIVLIIVLLLLLGRL
jgi:hypothetical protein